MSKTVKKHIKNSILTLLVIALAFVTSIPLQRFFDISEHITTLFAFAVFMVSLLTGINYAFTYPYYDIDFSVP